MRLRQWSGCLLRRAGVSVALVFVLAGTGWAAPEAGHPPVVPGYYRLKLDAKADPATLGEVLLGELNCTACHTAPNNNHVLQKGTPDLSNAGARLTPQWIRAYLSSPHTAKPGATMPDLFHASEAQSKAGAVDYLTHYLVSLGGPIAPSTEDGNTLLVEQGRKLFHTIGCVACHAPEGKENTQIPSVPFPNLAEKTTVAKLAEFLMDPLKVRPASRMPNLRLGSKDAKAIAVYLLRAQLDNPLARNAPPTQVHGVKFAYYEEAMDNCALEQLDKLKPKGEGRLENFSLNIPGRRNDNFAVKFSATLHVAKAGKYTFATNSDDGSRVYIGDELVVNNDGVHAAQRKTGTIELKEGDYPITVSYFQGGNEAVLRVMWAAPGQNRPFIIPAEALMVTGGQPMVPLGNEEFTVDPQKAQMGAQMFGMLGCASCHQIEGTKSLRTFKPLEALNPDAPEGCLGASIAKAVPNYDLDNEQRAALKAALKGIRNFSQPLNGKQQVTRIMAAFNCYGCHVRDNVGGTTQDRSEYFVMSSEFDMGDEGRLPPRLTAVGAKLLPQAIEKIVFEGKLHIRPVLATRMPTFSKEKAGAIIDALAADAPAQERQPKLSDIAARDGRTLFGTRGMGCVNCHGLLGVKSLGMPAPELTFEHERLRPSWFHELLVNPPSKNPATRMPAFWTDGQVAFKNLADGTMDGQIDAIWQYLSLGDAMALPAGLQPSQGIELIPTDTPIVHRTMMAGAGNRSILVGFPESVHVAFDADVVRLAKAWKGRFFDARGWWEQRGGQHLSPLGHDIINLPPGPAIAILANPTDPWPVPKRDDRNLGGRFKGYALDKEDRPIFHYILADTIDIHEQPLPLLRSSGPQLVRSFHVSSGKPDEKLYFLAAQGEKIESRSQGEYVIDEKLTVKFSNTSGVGQPIVRDSNNEKQLLLPLTGATSAFSVEMSW